MLRSADRVQFLREGLARYPDARETVNYFVKSVTEAILAAFDGKVDWTEFHPDRDAHGRLQVTKGIGSVDHFISAFLAGTLRTALEARKGSRWLSVCIGTPRVGRVRLWSPLAQAGLSRAGPFRCVISPVATRES